VSKNRLHLDLSSPPTKKSALRRKAEEIFFRHNYFHELNQ